MKKIAISILLLCSTLAIAASPADYNINVHVVSSKMRFIGGGTAVQRITVVINGKNYELQAVSQGVLALGDYKAKLNETRKNSYDIYQTYQFLMPDGKTRDFVLTAILP
jgi:hypothetical protein